MVLTPEHFQQIGAMALEIGSLEKHLRECSTWEAEVLLGLERWQTHDPCLLLDGTEEWELDDSLIYY